MHSKRTINIRVNNDHPSPFPVPEKIRNSLHKLNTGEKIHFGPGMCWRFATSKIVHYIEEWYVQLSEFYKINESNWWSKAEIIIAIKTKYLTLLKSLKFKLVGS